MSLLLDPQNIVQHSTDGSSELSAKVSKERNNKIDKNSLQKYKPYKKKIQLFSHGLPGQDQDTDSRPPNQRVNAFLHLCVVSYLTCRNKGDLSELRDCSVLTRPGSTSLGDICTFILISYCCFLWKLATRREIISGHFQRLSGERSGVSRSSSWRWGTELHLVRRSEVASSWLNTEIWSHVWSHLEKEPSRAVRLAEHK